VLWATITRTASEMCGLHKEYYRHLYKTLWWHHLIFLWFSVPMKLSCCGSCMLTPLRVSEFWSYISFEIFGSLKHVLPLFKLHIWKRSVTFHTATWHSIIYIFLTIRFISLGYVHCYVTTSEYINFKHYSSTLLSVHPWLRPVWLLQKRLTDPQPN